MNYGRIIRQKRQQMGLSPAELASRAGLPEKRILQWEAGETLPNLMQVPVLCAALDLPYETFFSQEKRAGRSHRRYAYPYFQLSLAPILCNQTMRTCRLRRGLTPEEAAQTMGVPAETLVKWEAGRAIPPLDRVPDICRALGIRLWQFFE